MKRNLNFIKNLLNLHTPAGYEDSVRDLLCKEMAGAELVKTDVLGNVIFKSIATGSSKKIMISGHVDEIGFICQKILDSGLITFLGLGGIDRKTLKGAHVEVLSDSGQIIHGVIGGRPAHVETDKQHESVDKIEDFLLDIGATSKEMVVDLGIHPGTVFTYQKGNNILEFGPKKDFIIGQGLDDKISVYIITEVMKRVGASVPNLYGVATSQEEVGARGARIATQFIQPDISIDLDVNFAAEPDLGIDQAIYGDIKLGGGLIIGYGPDKNRNVKIVCDAEEVGQIFSEVTGTTIHINEKDKNDFLSKAKSMGFSEIKKTEYEFVLNGENAVKNLGKNEKYSN